MRSCLLVAVILGGGAIAPAMAQFGPPMGGPPPEAFTACDGHAAGAACSHATPFGSVEGTCQIRGSRLQCIPAHPPGIEMGGMGMGGMGMMGMGGGGPHLDADGNEVDLHPSRRYGFDSAPVPVIRSQPQPFTLPSGQTHWYEAVYTPQGGVNWVQAKWLAEQAGGYLATIHSDAENAFVFGLIKDRKFWFQWGASHNYVMNGPFLGGFQPFGSPEPKGGWRWVTGEPWSYEHWAWDGMPGDRDPRNNTQPNDATGNQNVLAFGEINEPVSTWGDFPHKFSSYQSEHDGKSMGFVIEYDRMPSR